MRLSDYGARDRCESNGPQSDIVVKQLKIGEPVESECLVAEGEVEAYCEQLLDFVPCWVLVSNQRMSLFRDNELWLDIWYTQQPALFSGE